MGSALKYASDELKADKDIVLLAVENKPESLRYASKELRNDKDVVIKAISKVGWILKYASLQLRKDIQVVKIALNAEIKGASAFQHISSNLRKIPEIAILAINKDIYWAEPKGGWIYLKLSEELQNNPDIIKAENDRYQRIKDGPCIFP